MIAPRPVVRINRPLPLVGGRAWCRRAPQGGEGDRPSGKTPRAAGCGRRSPRAGLRVGLLGGSFNPAHAGHRAVSIEALRRLRLDRVLWLVSPQNPLKPTRGMAAFRERFASACDIARHPRIEVSDLEQRAGMRFTVDTIRHLQRDRRNRYVWLIGADNMIQLPQWKGWQEIMERVPIAVFDREPYVYRALAGEVAQRFAAARLPEEGATILADADPPAWTYVRFRRHPVSSTALRRRQAEDEEEAAF
ncbi:MAG TPA: nicotinate-nucleotide adenylyltransferase [Geminicoccaceae bacterium]